MKPRNHSFHQNCFLVKKDLEIALSTELEISEEQEPDYIFTLGHYIEEPVEEETTEECPF